VGKDVNEFFKFASPENLHPIDPIPEFWAELAWAAENEAVVHLDDLLLRRVRLGLLFHDGGTSKMAQVRNLVQKPLEWSDEIWQKELDRYQEIWQKSYSLPN
jgi:glycerol-3-phosphate dehydrogenase